MKYLALGAIWVLAACGRPQETKSIQDHPMSAEQRTQEKADREDIRELTKQVEDGELSLDEAACAFRGGDWNHDRDLCERHLMPHKTERDGKLTQDQILNDRIEALANMTSNHDSAITVETEAAAEFLKDHPENYRGAIQRALLADRKAKIMRPYDQTQMIALNGILY